jgi:hypothetical protein
VPMERPPPPLLQQLPLPMVVCQWLLLPRPLLCPCSPATLRTNSQTSSWPQALIL